MTLPKLSLVIPAHPSDSARLRELLESIDAQDYPKEKVEQLIIYEGNSEEAKAIGIQKATGQVIGMLCTDNVLIGPSFLRVMALAAMDPGIIGCYTSHYHYAKEDKPLSRYFSLLGANDPVCWWLGKADRSSYLSVGQLWPETRRFDRDIPSLGDNGFFLKAEAAQLATSSPETFGSCMCMCRRLQLLGLHTYRIIPSHEDFGVWHKTGESWRVYLAKRWRYVRELYWGKLSSRDWRMVSGPADYFRVILFGLASLCILPHLWVAARGYRRVPDSAWLIHIPLCFALTLMYALAWAEHLLLRLMDSCRAACTR